MFRPVVKGKYPAVILFSEIFQATGPIRRFAAFIAGHGYIVAVPEVYHELEPAGTVLAYDQAGSDKGNADKYGKAVSSYDSDARALLDYLHGLEDCTGRLGAIGICMGGHLAFRAAMNPDVLAPYAFTPPTFTATAWAWANTTIRWSAQVKSRASCCIYGGVRIPTFPSPVATWSRPGWTR